MPRRNVTLPVIDTGSIPGTPDLWYSGDERSAAVDDRIGTFPPWMLQLAGKRLKDRIELDQVIGTGAFGVVYSAIGTRRRYGGQPVAVKVLSTVALNRTRRRQIEHEILLHRRVAVHPNIVTVYDVVEDISCLYIVMDACVEGDLFKCITEDELYVGNDDMIKEVFSQLLDAVEFCHGKGVYHRDLKPENVLCQNGGTRVLLTDFGLATRDRESTDFRCGSEFYMSPECIGVKDVKFYLTAQNDLWALGIILINLITCRNPWRRADNQDRGFGQYCLNPSEYIVATLPVTSDVANLLGHILVPFPGMRMPISQMRRYIARIPRFLLTPLEATAAHEPAYDAALGLFEIMTKRRPHLLLEHYEDICLYYPDVAETLCSKLRASLIDNRIIGGPDDLFSGQEHTEEIAAELPEWAQPVTVDIHPEHLDDIADYPESPDMSRDDSTRTVATNGPITPATRPVQVVDTIPGIKLESVDQVGDRMGLLKVSTNGERLAAPSSSSSVFGNGLGTRIASVFGSAGSSWFKF